MRKRLLKIKWENILLTLFIPLAIGLILAICFCVTLTKQKKYSNEFNIIRRLLHSGTDDKTRGFIKC